MKGLSPSASVYDPSSSGQAHKFSIRGPSESHVSDCKSYSAIEPENFSVRPGSSMSSTSVRVVSTPSSARGLSPSPSVVSLSSEMSTLNPYAKEFKMNPNAKSFVPPAPLRTQVPISEGSFYYSSSMPSMPAVPHIHNLPVGTGVSEANMVYANDVSHAKMLLGSPGSSAESPGLSQVEIFLCAIIRDEVT